MVHAAEPFSRSGARLYRDNHPTLEDYCQEVHVHEMSRNDANRLILAGRIRAEMAPIVSKLGLPEPSNEAQFRELARLKEVRQALAQLRALLEG